MVQQVLLFSHSLQLRVPPLISRALIEVATAEPMEVHEKHVIILSVLISVCIMCPKFQSSKNRELCLSRETGAYTHTTLFNIFLIYAYIILNNCTFTVFLFQIIILPLA